MMDNELHNLETNVDSLLKSHGQLKVENNALRQKLAKLVQERTDLIEKNKKAATKVKRIISQLRNEIP